LAKDHGGHEQACALLCQAEVDSLAAGKPGAQVSPAAIFSKQIWVDGRRAQWDFAAAESRVCAGCRTNCSSSAAIGAGR